MSDYASRLGVSPLTFGAFHYSATVLAQHDGVPEEELSSFLAAMPVLLEQNKENVEPLYQSFLEASDSSLTS